LKIEIDGNDSLSHKQKERRQVIFRKYMGLLIIVHFSIITVALITVHSLHVP
jgi:hypothetical protein